MKTIAIILIIVGVVAAGAFFWFRTASAEVGSLNIYQGDVSVVRKGKTASGKTGTELRAGDVIKVGAGSRVSLILKDGSVVRLEENSEIEITELSFPSQGIDARLKLKSGRAWSHVEHKGDNTDFSVETPSIVATVSGTGFNVDYKNSTNAIYVYAGAVQGKLLSNLSSSKRVPAGFIFTLRDQSLEQDFTTGPMPVDSSYIDDWIVFNQGEDNKLEGKPAPAGADLNSVIATTTPETSTSTPQTATTTSASQPQNQPGQAATPPPVNNPPQSTSPSLPQKQVSKLEITSGSQTVKQSGTILFTATATYTDNSKENVISKVTWVQNPELGTFSSNGYFTAGLTGKTTVHAAFQGATSNAISITVEEPGPVLSGISIACEKQYSNTSTAVLLPTAQCSATAAYSDDTTKDITTAVSWSVSGSAGGSISSSGRYTPQSRGTAVITASYQGQSDSESLQIP